MGRKRSSQTAPGEATYIVRADSGLRIPGTPGQRFYWVSKGDELQASALSGLVVPALLEGGFLEKGSEPALPCESCQADGTDADKKKIYSSPEELSDHYREKHPALAPPEEA